MDAANATTLTRFDGVKIEYRRRADSGNEILHLEHREMRPDGTPHDDRWYTVTDSHLLWMQCHGHADQGRDIVDNLKAEQCDTANTAQVIVASE